MYILLHIFRSIYKSKYSESVKEKILYPVVKSVSFKLL